MTLLRAAKIKVMSSQQEPVLRAVSVGVLLLTILLRMWPCLLESQSAYSFNAKAVVSPVGMVERAELPNPCSIEFHSLQGVAEDAFRRSIDPHDDQKYHDEREAQLQGNDLLTQWIALDQSHEEDADEVDPENPCRRNNWESLFFPTCNAFHEVSNDPDETSFLG